MISPWVPEDDLNVLNLCDCDFNLFTYDDPSTSQIPYFGHSTVLREQVYNDLVSNVYAGYFNNRFLLVSSRLIVDLLKYRLKR